MTDAQRRELESLGNLGRPDPDANCMVKMGDFEQAAIRAALAELDALAADRDRAADTVGPPCDAIHEAEAAIRARLAADGRDPGPTTAFGGLLGRLPEVLDGLAKERDAVIGLFIRSRRLEPSNRSSYSPEEFVVAVPQDLADRSHKTHAAAAAAVLRAAGLGPDEERDHA